MASPLTDIPDHLLAEIFLRLPDPADLARASAACVPFRRLATQASFLRAFRRLHAPLHLGILNINGFHPALPPHPSAPAARAFALEADFSFSFLPASHRHWMKRDIRDGRVLLDSDPKEDVRSPVFAVCDPLHRRYVLLPPVPHHLAASLDHPVPMLPGPRCKPFLVPLSEEAAAGATTFRVVLMAYCKTSLAAFIFSSSTGQWQAVAVSILGLGCGRKKKLLLFDTMRMEFSGADLPPGDWSMDGLAIVEAGEGRLGMFGFDGDFASDLSYTIAQNEGENPSQWQVEKTISLDSKYQYHIKAGTERYSLLMRTEDSSLENPLVEYFAMDAKTLQLQRLCAKQGTHVLFGGHIYTNFPPSLLSSRTI